MIPVINEIGGATQQPQQANKPNANKAQAKPFVRPAAKNLPPKQSARHRGCAAKTALRHSRLLKRKAATMHFRHREGIEAVAALGNTRCNSAGIW